MKARCLFDPVLVITAVCCFLEPTPRKPIPVGKVAEDSRLLPGLQRSDNSAMPYNILHAHTAAHLYLLHMGTGEIPPCVISLHGSGFANNYISSFMGY